MNTNADGAHIALLKRQELLTVLGGIGQNAPGLGKPYNPSNPNKPYNPAYEQITPEDDFIIEALIGGKWIPLNQLPNVLPPPPGPALPPKKPGA
jgi:hypothetical protein